MAKADIELKKVDTVFDELKSIHEAISRRAYEFFRSQSDGPLGDWLNAERELVWKPAVELRQKETHVEILAAIPGVEPKDLDVQVTPEDVLIKADIHHKHTPDEGTIRICEFQAGNLFRSVHLPEKIDPGSVKAEYRNGMLKLTAAVAKEARSRRVEVEAA